MSIPTIQNSGITEEGSTEKNERYFDFSLNFWVRNLGNVKFISQGIGMDLNKRSGPEQKTITASKGSP